ncbi:MAG TPA: iron-containing redox enzyme family protein, partial [Diaminobutyricibacter sp.]
MTARITPRGPVSEAFLEALTRAAPSLADDLEHVVELANRALDSGADVVSDGDLQLTLLASYGLSYGAVVDADDLWEWHPAHLRVRATIEQSFEEQLRACLEPVALP